MTLPRQTSFRFGPFRLDLREQRLESGGRTIPVTPKVFDVLRVLVENGGHLVEKDVLLTAVWRDSFVEEGALNRNVSVLRKTLASVDPHQKYIETVPTRGYRFVAPVIGEHRPPDPPAVPPRRPAAALWTVPALLAAIAASAWLAVQRPAEDVTHARAPLDAVHRQATFTGKETSPTLSGDGRRIAYVSSRPREKVLVVQELAGGGPVEILAGPEIGHMRWHPQGSELLVWTRGANRDGVYVVPQLGGTPRLIARGLFTACWSPDGSRIAVATYLSGEIRIFDVHGRQERTLTLRGDHWSVADLDWTAVDDRILFASNDRQGRHAISTIRADGTDQRRIASVPTEVPSVRWGEGGHTIYYFQRVNQTLSLRRISTGSEMAAREPVTVIGGLEADGALALSADATRLVYARTPFHSNLVMLETRTGRTIELTSGTSLIERPRVSPDDTAIAFNRGHEPESHLFTMPLAPATPRQLTFLDGLTVSGAWSPDGTQIAFGSIHEGEPQIWAVPAAGGTARRVAAGAASHNLDIAWSSGPRILYQLAGNRNYSRIDPQTGEADLLVPRDSPGWIFSPVYSPDARHVAVMWTRPSARGVWVIDAEGGTRQVLAYRSGAPSLRPFGWSTDGLWVYFVEGKNGPSRGATSIVGETMTDAVVKRVNWKNRTVETVAAIGSSEIGAVAMTADGRRLIFPVFSSRSDVWVVDHFDPSLRARRGR